MIKKHKNINGLPLLKNYNNWCCPRLFINLNFVLSNQVFCCSTIRLYIDTQYVYPCLVYLTMYLSTVMVFFFRFVIYFCVRHSKNYENSTQSSIMILQLENNCLVLWKCYRPTSNIIISIIQSKLHIWSLWFAPIHIIGP